ncbi:MAG: hypothetical protein ACLTMP_07180 [Eggerthella lenta]
MGVIVSVVIGIALTLPIVGGHLRRSRADGLAGGAALAGCCARWWASPC